MNTLLRTGANASPDKTNPAVTENNASGSNSISHVVSQNDMTGEPEETLVLDRRAELGPAQMVELKLRNLLRGKALPVSHIQMVNSLRSRN
jgi:hypothetical protein